MNNPRFANSLLALCLALLAAVTAFAQHEHHHSTTPAAPATDKTEAVKLTIPDVPVIDQDGRELHFYRDLVKGKTVAVNFIFTTCTTICPPLGATTAKLQNLLGERVGKDVQLISISVDPATDTPERLKAWGAKFGAKPGWTFITGNKPEMDQLLKALGGFTARKEDHSPIILIGNEAGGDWTRAYGLSKPTQLAALVEEKLKAAPPSAATSQSPALKYFTDVELVNQDGEKMRLYTDLIKGKTVVINAFFTTCTNVCPPMNKNFARVQEAIGDRLGKDVHIISITVDPDTDTPAKMKEYAAKFGARPGWHFLSGKKENVELALFKLGQYVQDKNDHLTVVLIGNDKTGLWKKAHGLARAEALIATVNSVMDDKAQAEGGQ